MAYHESAFIINSVKKIFVIIVCAFALVPIANALDQTILTVAAYPAVDEIVKAALPEWQKSTLRFRSRLSAANSMTTTPP